MSVTISEPRDRGTSTQASLHWLFICSAPAADDLQDQIVPVFKQISCQIFQSAAKKCEIAFYQNTKEHFKETEKAVKQEQVKCSDKMSFFAVVIIKPATF